MELSLAMMSVVLMIALILAVTHTGLTRQRLCRAVGETARSASVGAKNPHADGERVFGAARNTHSSTSNLSLDIEIRDQWVSITGTTQIRGFGSIFGGTTTCEVTTKLETNRQ